MEQPEIGNDPAGAQSRVGEAEANLSVGLGIEPTYKIEILWGHVEIRSWIEFDGDKYIGMGSKKTFDENGKLVAYDESPTGLVATYA